MAIYDLFISYSSRDRKWAEQFETDFRTSYPQLRVFFDRTSIMAGAAWRQDLDNAIYNSKHMLFFWSNNADTPNAAGVKEVDPEIESFRAHRKLTPELEGSERRMFYVPLEGARGGGVGDFQGFPALQPYYQPQAGDLGISNLATNPALQEWRRMIQMVGDAISNVAKTTEIAAGIIATNVSQLPLIDMIHGMKKKPDGPTLDDFLARFGLTWSDVRDRYGRSALEWRPKGTLETITTLFEEVRVRVNAQLDNAADRFHWKYLDLTSSADYKTNIGRMYEGPSVVLFDPISLYDSICPGVLLDLSDYVVNDASVVLSLSPHVKDASDLEVQYLRSVSNFLDDYLLPKIPPGAIFSARCALDVQRTSQIEPLIRNRLRYRHLLERQNAQREAAKESTGHR